MIYLASASPRRRKILKEMGFRFRVLKPDYKEVNPKSAHPIRTARTHALGKALSALKWVRNGIVLGADTLVYADRKLIGKPRNLKDAYRILGQLQGRAHTVYTAVALLKVQDGDLCFRKVFVEKTRVWLKSMERSEMTRYFNIIKPLDKAGAYAIQSKTGNLVAKIRGSGANAAGLPAEALQKELSKPVWTQAVFGAKLIFKREDP